MSQIHPAGAPIGTLENITRANVERLGIAWVGDEVSVIAQICSVDGGQAEVRPGGAGIRADSQLSDEIGSNKAAKVCINHSRIGGAHRNSEIASLGQIV